jgi:hypothetical protein
MKIRDEKLKQKASIPKKLEDGWEPIIDMHVNGFDCHALCNLGASISIMPRKIYDMLDLSPLEKCYYCVPIADVAKKKPLRRINDVLIMVNNNLGPVDFLVMDVECNASYPIILGRPFLRTVGTIIDMREGTINVGDIPNRYTSDVVLNQQARVAHQGWYGGFAIPGGPVAEANMAVLDAGANGGYLDRSMADC